MFIMLLGHLAGEAVNGREGIQMNKTMDNITGGLKNSPHMITILLIVGAFLFYLIRHDEMGMKNNERNELVAKQRIERCHDTQNDSTEIMKKLNDTLNKQGNSFHELSVTLSDLKAVVSMHNSKMGILLAEMTAMLKKLEDMEHRLNDKEREQEIEEEVKKRKK